MRRYLLPAAVTTAVGAIVVLLVLSNRERKKEPVPRSTPTHAEQPVDKTSHDTGRRNTPTKLTESRALSELERSLGRKDLSNALHFAHEVILDLDNIMENPRLMRNLMNAIRANGPGSDDPKRRDVVLPILASINSPEATEMIRSEYFKALDENERITLLRGMARPHHDPQTAAVWALDRALNAERAPDRRRAYELVRDLAKDENLTFTLAAQIRAATTRAGQSKYLLGEIASLGSPVKPARAYMRRILASGPSPDELAIISASVPSWGREKDAARLEQLALEFPGAAFVLQQFADDTRMARRMEAGTADEQAREQAAREAAKAEEERKKDQ
ncbi:MAG: hypothetical protein ACYTGN_03725 [Planctomycetota bacterium]|jgi:hypothetical protein